jgi:hypothetical protein
MNVSCALNCSVFMKRKTVSPEWNFVSINFSRSLFKIYCEEILSFSVMALTPGDDSNANRSFLIIKGN